MKIRKNILHDELKPQEKFDILFSNLDHELEFHTYNSNILIE